MMMVYTHIPSKRLIYTLNVVFKYVLGVDYTLTTDLNLFKNSSSAKLNYSNTFVENVFQIVPSHLLFENNVKQYEFVVDEVNNIPYFFKTKENEYDVLACVFWMITRYEEYLPFTPDHHGRFSAKQSLAFKHCFLRKPVVNYWCEHIKQEIEKQTDKSMFPSKSTSFINSLDIDVAYMYKGKPLWKFLGGWFKDVLKNRKQEKGLRWNYLKSKTDAFDTYDFIASSSQNIKTIFFFLIGNASKYDHNISHRKKALQNLIKNVAKDYEVGIHPSYLSNQDTRKVAQEIGRLEKIIKTPIKISRQHFLKLEFPATYENLISQNITVDYSMGYADAVGFRAGICNAYPFYNLRTEQQENLWVVPFQVMDGTLNQYLKLKPKKAIDVTREIVDEVKKVKGIYVSLWHNSSLCELDVWKGWKLVYQETLKMMK